MLEQKLQKVIDETEQQRDKLKTQQHSLEEALERKVQDFIGQNKQQKEENKGWRNELEEMLENRIQQFTDHGKEVELKFGSIVQSVIY